MAAINKNFVIKNGVEIGDNLIFGNKDQLRVGVGTTVPNYTLDVRGGIGATSVSVGQTITANAGIITTVQARNLTVGDRLVYNIGIGTELSISGVTTTTNLNVTGVGTVSNLSSGIATITKVDVTLLDADFVSAPWIQVGSALTFTTGIGTNLNVSGVGTVGSLSIGSNQVISSGRELQNIASLDATTTATIEAAIANAPNTFSDLTVTGIATFNNNIGVAGIVTAPAIRVSWAQVGRGVTFTTGIGTFVNVTGIATIANLFVSGIASVGTAITMDGGTGIISAYKYYGDGSGLTGTISGIGIRSEGADIGYGATIIDFKGPGVSTITSISAGIVTVFFEGGGAGSTIDKQTFNVGAAGTNLVTLTNSYTSGYIDVFLNGLKLIPTTDYTETSSNVITLTTAAVNGDVIETISFRSISITDNAIGIQSGGVSVGSTITTLNFIGAGNTFLNRGNGIIDISISGGGIGIQSAGSQIGTGVTQLNFIGAGNTFRVENGTVDVSISGGGSGVSTSGITTSAIFSNFGTIYENQDLGQTGYNYFAAGPLAITASVTVGAGNTFVII